MMLETRVLADQLQSIAELNSEWLEALRASARCDPSHFPLPALLRPLVATLTPADCEARGRCGVLLVDGGFDNPTRWREISPSALDAQQSARAPWLSYRRAVMLAHSALLVVWHAVHACPAAAGVLLGMSEPVLTAFRTLRLVDLARVARRHPGWFRPRWADRVDIWAGILQSHSAHALSSTVLHCLKLSATHSTPLLKAAEASG